MLAISRLEILNNILRFVSCPNNWAAATNLDTKKKKRRDHCHIIHVKTLGLS